MSLAARPRGLIRSSLFHASLEAAVVGGMFACWEAWIVPVVQVRLGAAASVIGWLSLIPQLIAIGAGPWAGQVITWLGGNKRTAILTSWVQIAAMVLLAVLVQLSPAEGQAPVWTIPVAIALVVMMNGVGVLAGPAWTSWMGGQIPPGVRGRYTARRAAWFHASRLAFAGLYAVVIILLPVAHTVAGLQVILLIAVVSRMASIWCQERQGDPPSRPAPPPTLSGRNAAQMTTFLQFVRKLPTFPFGRYVLAWSVTNFGIMVAAPFFIPFLVAAVADGGRDLLKDPQLYTLVVYTNTISRLIAFPLAGRLVHHHGPAAVLRIAATIILVIPIGWVLPGGVWPILVAEVISGVAWALADCACGALVFGCHPDPQTRVHWFAWQNTIFNLCCMFGVGLGMLLVDATWLPAIWGSRFHTIFLLAVLLRLPGVILAWKLLPALKGEPEDEEGRHVRLWHLIPGAEMASNLGRSLVGMLKRDE